MGLGLFLWARDDKKGWGDLGEGITVGVIVAIALMGVQRDADNRTREATARRDDQLRQAAERQSLQLSLTMQRELGGVALADRDLRGFILAHKSFARADLHGANLARADLEGSRFPEANLLGANMDKHGFDGPTYEVRGCHPRSPSSSPQVRLPACAGRISRRRISED